jgi:5'-3' exonuclease
MGIRGLYTYLKHYRTSFDLREKAASVKTSLRIGIDAMSFLYRFKEETNNILSVLKTLKSHNHKIIFVFDGKPPIEKNDEIVSRKEARNAAAAKVATLETFLQSDSAKTIDSMTLHVLEDSLLRSQTKSWCASRTIRRAFQDLLWDESIPYVKSLSEADDVLIDLYTAGKLDVVMSSDMDYLASGVNQLWIPSKKGTYWFEEICLEEVLKGEEITLEQFMEIGVLSTKYEVSCETAFTWLRYYSSCAKILESRVSKAPAFTLEDIQHGIQRFKAEPVYSRIRPDHLERVVEFLDAL